jgi:hypothetical protein
MDPTNYTGSNSRSYIGKERIEDIDDDEVQKYKNTVFGKISMES